MSNIIVPYCHHIHHALKYDNEFIKEIEHTKEILRRNLNNNTNNKTDSKTNQSIESSSQKDTLIILPNELIMNYIISYCTVDILNSISLTNMTWNTFIKSSNVDTIWNFNCILDYNTSFTALRNQKNPNNPSSPRELYIHLTQSFQRLKREWFGSIKKPNLVIPMI